MVSSQRHLFISYTSLQIMIHNPVLLFFAHQVWLMRRSRLGSSGVAFVRFVSLLIFLAKLAFYRKNKQKNVFLKN
ncbi:MAG: hypothetical protein ACLUHA_02585 [Bacteroides stercoris]